MILSPIVDREMPTTDRKHDIRTTEKRRENKNPPSVIVSCLRVVD